jgi:threonylcarbamoyladenosine tRNA methylthiotransferase MtaB
MPLTFAWKAAACFMSMDFRHCNSFHASFSAGDRTRSFLKVQDGCDYFCSFCTIPLARGFSRSDTVASTLISAQKALETGVKEIVLTGVNIGDFGKQKIFQKNHYVIFIIKEESWNK